MFCAISGQPCTDPVVAPSGYIFNRPLIEKHLQITKTCPVSNTPLELTDLISIKSPANKDLPNSIAVTPKSQALTSIPSLLKSFQSEWDALMLQVHDVKVQNADLRQQLSRALYQNDAACRVVARLVKENEEVSVQLNALQSKLMEGVGHVGSPMNTTGSVSQAALTSSETSSLQVPVTPVNQLSTRMLSPKTGDSSSMVESGHEPRSDKLNLPQEVILDFQSTNARLMATRKKRKTELTASNDMIASFTAVKVGEISHSGVAAVALAPSKTNTTPISTLVFKSASRGLLHMTIDSKQIKPFVAPLKSSSVTCVAILDEDQILASLRDKLVIATPDKVITDQATKLGGPIVHMTVHPSNKYVMVATSTNVLAMYQIIDAGASIEKVYEIRDLCTTDTRKQKVSIVSQLQFHPDGALVAACTPQGVLIYSATDATQVSSLVVNKEDEVSVDTACTAMEFMENGWLLAVAYTGGVVHVWDLRKIVIVATLVHDHTVTVLASDYTGTYLSVGLQSGHVYVYAYASKQFKQVFPSLEENNSHHLVMESPISALVWDLHSLSLVVTGLESKLVLRLVVKGSGSTETMSLQEENVLESTAGGDGSRMDVD